MTSIAEPSLELEPSINHQEQSQPNKLLVSLVLLLLLDSAISLVASSRAGFELRLDEIVADDAEF